ARPDNEDFDSPTFSAIDNGVGGQTGSRLGLAYFDYPGQTTAQQLGLNYAEGLMMTYAEQQFLLAEAAALGWINNDVEAHYKSGIKASHDYYQVNYTPYGFSDFEDFYSNSGVAYDEVIDIWEQKWLSLFFTAMEPYFELRRWYVSEGGFENLRFVKEPTGTNYNDYALPMRFLYPGQEQSLNQENYNAAKAQYNGINGKMWILSN
ncbi:MAG: SusD/RagB family nutrient-binding outer membrane lipoprotein, partial [Flavobacteriaceae bacterium]